MIESINGHADVGTNSWSGDRICSLVFIETMGVMLLTDRTKSTTIASADRVKTMTTEDHIMESNRQKWVAVYMAIELSL